MLAGLVLLPLIFVLLVEFRPGWYRPAGTDPESLEEARLHATRVADFISDRMVRREPFDVTLTGATANHWLATLLYDRPQLVEKLPSYLVRPTVGFGDDGIQVGATYERWGVRAVVSLRCSFELDGADLLQFRFERFAVGALSIPVGFCLFFTDPESSMLEDSKTWSTILESGSERRSQQLSFGDLVRGVHLRNHFVWPNGKRPFRIGSVRIVGDSLRLLIEPL